MDLLSHYWDRQLHAGLIVYRTVFMRDLAAGGGTFFSKLLLNALFFSASKHVPESWEDSSDPASSGSRYRKRFFELLEGERYRCSITTIQGLLIVANTLFSRCDERSLSWLLTGNAFQMLVHMRLHLDDLSESPEKREVRRRLYWGAYVLDKVQSLYQGRPPYLRVLESNVPMTFVDDFEEFEPFHGDSFSCLSGHTAPILCHHISQLQMYASLCIIMERIHVRMYRMRDLDSVDGSTVHTDIATLWQDLRQWRANVPTHLSAFTSSQNAEEPPLPNAVAILALYNVLTIQLWQWQIVSPLTARSLTIDTHNVVPGLSAAKEICHLIHTSAQYYAPASATFTLSYAAHIAATVLVRIMTQDSTAISEMRDYLQLCLEFLRMQTHLYYSSRRSLKGLETMIERAGIIFSESEDSEAMALETSSSRIRITSPVTGMDQGVMTSGAGFSFDAAGMVFDPIAFSLEDLDSWSRAFHAEQSDIDIEGTAPLFG
ncbi:hypothetical protein E4T50_00265 [Aureobasidium sp. EXF-12298]|nr:hypothetical protein E4T50_00265 [Aureobasidium sp. EXF-12298]